MQKYTHLVVGATAGAIVAVLLGLNVDIIS